MLNSLVTALSFVPTYAVAKEFCVFLPALQRCENSLYIAVSMHKVFGDERKHAQDLVVDGIIILKMILNKYVEVGGGGGSSGQARNANACAQTN